MTNTKIAMAKLIQRAVVARSLPNRKKYMRN
jgi:hypothetical protein